MQITVLTENMAGGKFAAEHGLSYLVDLGSERILFDTGHTDIFLQNAKKLGINISNDIQKIVLSHGHWDHGNGLKYIENKELICHPDVFVKRFRQGETENIGLDQTHKELTTRFQLKLHKEPFQITNNCWFLGEIPRTNNFESQSTYFVLEDNSPDFVMDDSAIAVVENDRLIVVTGCSHAGICNIVDYAQKVTGISNVVAVIGGFHLKYQNEQTYNTIEYFKQFNGIRFFPSHCTELPALALFYEHFGIKQVRTGMSFQFA